MALFDTTLENYYIYGVGYPAHGILTPTQINILKNSRKKFIVSLKLIFIFSLERLIYFKLCCWNKLTAVLDTNLENGYI